jgi:alpha-1,3-rhamnosyl/mannosyltransferase
MACGTPVVCSNVASLPEVVGNAALTAEPDDVGSLHKAVEQMLFDPDVRHGFIGRGLSHAKNFSWTKCAEQTTAVYRRALDAIH